MFKKVGMILWALITVWGIVLLIIIGTQGCGAKIPFIGGEKHSEAYEYAEETPGVPVVYEGGLLVLTEGIGPTAKEAAEEAIKRADTALKGAFRDRRGATLHERLFGQTISMEILERHASHRDGTVTVRVLAFAPLK